MSETLEEMCRNHFNEPVLLLDQVGRLIGYGEDEHDAYLIIKYPNGVRDGREIWHTCVGGYYWLTLLKEQGKVISTQGEHWDDFYRIDHCLELNGAPKEKEFKVVYR